MCLETAFINNTLHVINGELKVFSCLLGIIFSTRSTSVALIWLQMNQASVSRVMEHSEGGGGLVSVNVLVCCSPHLPKFMYLKQQFSIVIWSANTQENVEVACQVCLLL